MRNLQSTAFYFSLRESLQSLRTNPLRSFLSIIGVVFGVASVVAMLGIGMGAEKEIEALLDRLGARNIHITARDLDRGEWQQVIRQSTGLGDRDESAVRGMFATNDIAKIAHWSSSRVNRDLPQTKLSIYGLTPNYRRVIGTAVSAGRSFTPFENEHSSPVAVVGANLARMWFGDDFSDAIGQHVRIDRSWFSIIGVLQAKASEPDEERVDKPDDQRTSGADVRFMNLGDSLLLPLSTASKRLGPKGILSSLDRLVLKLNEAEDPIAARIRIASLLSRLHRGAEVIDVTAADEIIEQKKSTTRLFSYFLLTIALISLVVGGIGIANVMLAGMVERIREVGLRRAIGAKRRHIMVQFLTESLVICMIGGILGGAVGLLVAAGIGAMTGWAIAFPWWGLLVALLISTLVGLAAGLYPAWNASRISPIEALQGRA